MKTKIRSMRWDDVEAVAKLSTQLGYPSTKMNILKRFGRIKDNAKHRIFVAADETGQIIGFVHIYVRYLLLSDPHAEIGGFAVDEAARGRGVGKLLNGAVEKWAVERGCKEIRLGSNIIRKEAHAFYAKLGYRTEKTQYRLSKVLAHS